MAPRNSGSLADQLSALLAYRNRPDHPPEPMTSNWSLAPANDNRPAIRLDQLSNDRLLKVTPSIEEIFRNMREDWMWDDQGRVVSIGRLRFADGKSHTEVAYRRGIDGTVERYRRLLPRGAMLGCTETLTDEAGGQGTGVTISNSTFCERMNVASREFIPSGRRRTGRSFTAEQSRKIIAEAMANTPRMPAITKCPPGVASGTAQFSDQFIGMKIGSTGKGGMIHWVDLYTAGRDWEDSKKAIDSLGSQDRETLDAAMTAETFADISPGGSVQGARKRGKRLLRAANDNLAEYLKKFTA